LFSKIKIHKYRIEIFEIYDVKKKKKNNWIENSNQKVSNLFNVRKKMVYQTWLFSEVLYDTDDKLSLFFGIISLIPLLILFILTILSSIPTVVSRNSARFLIILLINEAICQLLKRVFRQGRPEPAWPYEMRASRERQLGHGMPSSHTQLMFCGAMTTFLLSTAANNKGTTTNALHKYRLFRFGFWVLALLVGISRVYNGYHSVSQVIAGAVVGCAVAFGLVQIKLIKTAAELLTQGLQQIATW
jgi:membrane-associated phospholipid phosphatase